MAPFVCVPMPVLGHAADPDAHVTLWIPADALAVVAKEDYGFSVEEQDAFAVRAPVTERWRTSLRRLAGLWGAAHVRDADRTIYDFRACARTDPCEP